MFEWFNPLYKSDAANGFKTQNFVKVCTCHQSSFYVFVHIFSTIVLERDLEDLKREREREREKPIMLHVHINEFNLCSYIGILSNKLNLIHPKLIFEAKAGQK